MKTIHAAFDQPEMSWRRKMSLRIRIIIQIQTTQLKKRIIVQKTSRNG